VWLILGFHICFCIANDMSRVHGYVDPLDGGGLLGLLCTDGKWRVVQLVRARRVGALGCGSLMRLVRERERERTMGLCSWVVKGGGTLCREWCTCEWGDRVVLGAVGNGRGGAPFIG
jgi:hypothetical protein